MRVCRRLTCQKGFKMEYFIDYKIGDMVLLKGEVIPTIIHSIYMDSEEGVRYNYYSVNDSIDPKDILGKARVELIES